MGAMTEILSYLLQTFLSLLLLAVLLRFLLQLVRADFYNPISQFIVKVTNPFLAPLRRIIPGMWGVDMATVLLLVLLQMLGITAILLLSDYSLPNVLLLLVWAVLGVAGLLVNFYFFAILAMIILSWVAPGSRNPVVYLLYQLTEPVMAPFRKILPPIGGLDLSPILVFILINIIQIALRNLAWNTGLPSGLFLWY